MTKLEELRAHIERSQNLQVGDLVWCPETRRGGPNPDVVVPAYVGLVIDRCGHKVTVLGGECESWDGVKGRCTWDISDIKLLEPVK